MKFNLNIAEEKWNLVSEKGYPEDGEWCFLIYECKGEYHYFVGGYHEDESQFYVNFGFGGAVVDAVDVYAWALFEDAEYLSVSAT